MSSHRVRGGRLQRRSSRIRDLNSAGSASEDDEKYSSDQQQQQQEAHSDAYESDSKDDADTEVASFSSTERLLKAIKHVKPWQKGAVVDGTVITCREFLLQFQTNLEGDGATEQQMLKLIPRKLVGKALRWYWELRNSQDDCLASWETFTQSMLEMWGDIPPPNVAWDNLRACDMLAGETIQDHADRFNLLVLDLPQPRDLWHVYNIYIQKMRPATRNYLVSTFQRQLG